MKGLSRREWMVAAGGSSLVGCSCLFGCRSIPWTGRRQLMVVPEPREIELGEEAFREIVRQYRPSRNLRWTNMVNRVGQRIAAVSGREDYAWEFALLEDPQQNAFALPGGKVAVYEGLLPWCEHEAGLSVVMGHEVAHVLARHGGERMSQHWAVDASKQVSERITRGHPPSQRDRLLWAHGLATEYGVLLPFNRQQESEADQIGLVLMAKAGYDPRQAPEFWRRLASADDSRKPADPLPEFLSTHPSDDRRYRDLVKQLPEAIDQYLRSVEQLGLGQTVSTRPAPGTEIEPSFIDRTMLSLVPPDHWLNFNATV